MRVQLDAHRTFKFCTDKLWIRLYTPTFRLWTGQTIDIHVGLDTALRCMAGPGQFQAGFVLLGFGAGFNYEQREDTTLAQHLARHDRLTRTLYSPWLTLTIALLTLGLFWLAWRGWLDQSGEGARQGLSEERGGSGHAEQRR